ncbi:potassium/proton antiporter [Baekduia soli]|uniref:Potassium/proton antiporter n=1 Tax=Baekduia soli TaxID=496014 RepID=A0A5B8U4Q9_9ACTN|nr:potassium/proton antiporter [Baekduia soli]QEC48053.1 potassium/proton antiporter [Baekduia soli]
MHDGERILIAGALLTVGLLASLVATRVRVPGLVLFLGVGMAVGSDGAGLIDFSDYGAARTVGIVALALILFEGGLAAGFDEIRPVLWPSLSLAIVGTMATAAITGLVAAWLFDFSTAEGLLVGAIVAGTDGAAIFALLRGSTLRRRLARTLEGESGLNDPIAILLVLGFIEVLTHPGYGVPDFAWLFVRQLGIGAVVGIGVGYAASLALRETRLSTAGLYPVATLAAAALAFGAADTAHGSGFLAVYLTGLMVGSVEISARQTIASFHEGLAWVAQLGMFLVLGLLVFPHELGAVAFEGTVLALVLVFVARPLSTALAATPFGFGVREQAVLGWAGLRGAVPVVLATFPVIADVPRSHDFFNIVFFVVLLSTILQGSTFEPLARRLGMTTDEPALPRPLAESGTIRRLGAEVLEFPVGAGDAIVGLAVRDLGLPREAVVNVIVREGQAIPPRGSTRVETGDRLHVLYREETSRQLGALTSSWRRGPVGPQPRPPRTMRGASTVFSSRPWSPSDGDATRPARVAGLEVVELLRLRRDEPGSLVVLQDGRYAVCGRILVIGARRQIVRWIEQQMRRASAEERAWLRTVLGAVATDAQEVGPGA